MLAKKCKSAIYHMQSTSVCLYVVAQNELKFVDVLKTSQTREGLTIISVDGVASVSSIGINLLWESRKYA